MRRGTCRASIWSPPPRELAVINGRGAMPPPGPPQHHLSPASGTGSHRAFSGSSLPGFSGPGFGEPPIANQSILAGFLNVGCEVSTLDSNTAVRRTVEMEALKLELERLEERIAPWFVGGVVLQGAVGASGGAAAGAGG